MTDSDFGINFEACNALCGFLIMCRTPRRVALHHLGHGLTHLTANEREYIRSFVLDHSPVENEGRVHRDMEGRIL